MVILVWVAFVNALIWICLLIVDLICFGVDDGLFV